MQRSNDPTSRSSPRGPAGKALFQIAAGIVVLSLVDLLMGRALILLGIEFPAFVLAMMLVFCILSLLRLQNAALVERVCVWFAPASAFLGRWMALFFLPPLVLIPDRSAPDAADLASLVLLGVGGFAATFCVAGIIAQGPSSKLQVAKVAAKVVRLPFERSGFFLGATGLALGAGTGVLVVRHVALSWILGIALTVAAYTGSEILRDGLARRGFSTLAVVMHPVLLGAGVIALVWRMLGFSLDEYLSSDGTSAGGALAFFLRPAVVSLAFALDAQRSFIRARALVLLGATFCATAFSLFSTAWLAGALGMSGEYSRASLSRSITTPVALSMARLLGADGGLTAALVILTGVLGALFAVPLGRRVGFESSFVLGVATGASSHGIGTAALAREDSVAAAFSAVSFALMAIFGALFVSHPGVRHVLLSLL